MTVPHAGSCLCGAVAFEVEGAFARFYLCHCSHCRKGTGSAHASNLFAPVATLRWVRGEEEVRVFRLPDTRHARSFCSACGSALPTPLGTSGGVMVPAGALDTPVTKRPDAHIFTDSRADWDEALERVPKQPSWPSKTT